MKYLFLFLLVGLVSCGGDATQEATQNVAKEKIKPVKQPKFSDMEGFRVYIDYNKKKIKKILPKNYTGVVYRCHPAYGEGEWWDYVLFTFDYKDGKENGFYRTWHSENQLWTESQNKDDECIRQRQWFKSGKLKRESIYFPEERMWKSKAWYEHGQLRMESISQNGSECINRYDEYGRKKENYSHEKGCD